MIFETFKKSLKCENKTRIFATMTSVMKTLKSLDIMENFGLHIFHV